MDEIESRLRFLRRDPPPVYDDQVAADLRRARGAAGRRRAARIGTGAVTLAAVGAVAGVVVANQPGDSTPPSAKAPSHAASKAPTSKAPTSKAPASKTPGLRLVDYTGAQQPGFTVTKVPDGFVLQGATAYSLDVARAEDHSSLDSFAGKLVVMLKSKDAPFVRTGDVVPVHGTTGYLRDEPGAATTLEYSDGDHVVLIQAWDSLGLTDQQLGEFANGVTVTDAAQAGVG